MCGPRRFQKCYRRTPRPTKVFEGADKIQLRIIPDRLLGRPANGNQA